MFCSYLKSSSLGLLVGAQCLMIPYGAKLWEESENDDPGSILVLACSFFRHFLTSEESGTFPSPSPLRAHTSLLSHCHTFIFTVAVSRQLAVFPRSFCIVLLPSLLLSSHSHQSLITSLLLLRLTPALWLLDLQPSPSFLGIFLATCSSLWVRSCLSRCVPSFAASSFFQTSNLPACLPFRAPLLSRRYLAFPLSTCCSSLASILLNALL